MGQGEDSGRRAREAASKPPGEPRWPVPRAAVRATPLQEAAHGVNCHRLLPPAPRLQRRVAAHTVGLASRSQPGTLVGPRGLPATLGMVLSQLEGPPRVQRRGPAAGRPAGIRASSQHSVARGTAEENRQAAAAAQPRQGEPHPAAERSCPEPGPETRPPQAPLLTPRPCALPTGSSVPLVTAWPHGHMQGDSAGMDPDSGVPRPPHPAGH